MRRTILTLILLSSPGLATADTIGGAEAATIAGEAGEQLIDTAKARGGTEVYEAGTNWRRQTSQLEILGNGGDKRYSSSGSHEVSGSKLKGSLSTVFNPTFLFGDKKPIRTRSIARSEERRVGKE